MRLSEVYIKISYSNSIINGMPQQTHKGLLLSPCRRKSGKLSVPALQLFPFLCHGKGFHGKGLWN